MVDANNSRPALLTGHAAESRMGSRGKLMT
jgi:hypothetical protein